jgi:hypothetical protein
MNDYSPLSSPSRDHSRSPWNKDKIIGPRPPLRPGHVWRYLGVDVDDALEIAEKINV